MTEPLSSPSRRVVLVDDDGVCLAMLSSRLRKRGFDVCAYGDPREAMRQLPLDLPAAVITDLRMPHMSGLEVVQEVRLQLGSNAPPVLVVSATDEEAMLEEAFRLGATDYLLKPVNEAELGAKLERALRPRKVAQFTPIPDRVGDWTLLECIGRGGTACVFTAVRGQDPTVRALKVVWPHLVGNTETLLRFRREIDTLCGLSHPRLVRFVESGRHEDCFYYVMDFLPGGSVRQRLRRAGPQPAAAALTLIEEVGEALGHLHAAGLVHRDVKPGNVFYDADGAHVLGDFGLARRLTDRGITLSREFIGTPLYLAPEVFRSPEFDESVDLYALGVSAFEALLGRAPMTEDDSMTLIGRILDGEFPRPRDLLPDLPAPLLALLERLLAPADARPRGAAEVVALAREARAALPR
ncbi:MAG: protein kinase [Planctomycetes bacterium]|nr:protein kinase [Planctomycetota bacterium]